MDNFFFFFFLNIIIPNPSNQIIIPLRTLTISSKWKKGTQNIAGLSVETWIYVGNSRNPFVSKNFNFFPMIINYPPLIIPDDMFCVGEALSKMEYLFSKPHNPQFFCSSGIFFGSATGSFNADGLEIKLQNVWARAAEFNWSRLQMPKSPPSIGFVTLD